MKEPLIELQTRLAFLDDLVQALNDTVAAHDQKLDRIECAIADLKDQLRDRPGDDEVDEDRAPPHY